MRVYLLISLFVVSCVPTSYANDYQESIDGDLSGDPLNPTAVSLDVGINTVTGRVSAPDDTRDYFTFSIGAGQELTELFLLEYTDLDTGGTGNRGFIHLDDGSQSVIPGPTTALEFLGGSHLDRATFPSPSDDVLQALAAAPQGGVGFTTPLGPGDYTINVQQTGPQSTGYSLALNVVPEPSGVMLFAAAALGLVVQRSRSTDRR